MKERNIIQNQIRRIHTFVDFVISLIVKQRKEKIIKVTTPKITIYILLRNPKKMKLLATDVKERLMLTRDSTVASKMIQKNIMLNAWTI